MNYSKIALISIALIGAEITDSTFSRLFSSIGFTTDGQKIAQCYTVGTFMNDEAEGTIWKRAADEKLSKWLESSCSSSARECSNRHQSLINWAMRKSHPDGNSPDKSILKDWKNSEFCKDLVNDFKKTQQENNTPPSSNTINDVTPSLNTINQQPKKPNSITYTPPNISIQPEILYPELKRNNLEPFISRIDKFLNNPAVFINECMVSSINYSKQRGGLSNNEAEDWAQKACSQEIQEYQICLKDSDKTHIINCFSELASRGD